MNARVKPDRLPANQPVYPAHVAAPSILGTSHSLHFSRPDLLLLRMLLSPVLVSGLLLLICFYYEGEIEDIYSTMAVFAFLVSFNIFMESDFEKCQGALGIARACGAILIKWSLVVGVLLFIAFATKTSQTFSRRVILTWIALTPFALMSCQYCFQRMARVITAATSPQRAIIVGATPLAYSLLKRIKDDPSLGIRVVGLSEDRSASRLSGEPASRVVCPLSEVAEYVKRNQIQAVYISLPVLQSPRIMAILDDLRDTTASIYFVPDIFMFDLIQARLGQVAGVPVVAVCDTPFHGLRGLLKRLLDIAAASLILLVLSPLMALLALGVKLSSPGPALFRQRRYGLDGAEIVVFKFRTMRVCDDGALIRQATRDDPRVTPLGAFLRRYSLDELPQFINVLQGRMSIVGPRPHAVAHNELYRRLIRGYMIRHKVKPGITGLAQVNGLRGETDDIAKMKARIDQDLEYLRNWSPMLDIWIMLRTFKVFLSPQNAY